MDSGNKRRHLKYPTVREWWSGSWNAHIMAYCTILMVIKIYACSFI